MKGAALAAHFLNSWGFGLCRRFQLQALRLLQNADMKQRLSTSLALLMSLLVLQRKVSTMTKRRLRAIAQLLSVALVFAFVPVLAYAIDGADRDSAGGISSTSVTDLSAATLSANADDDEGDEEDDEDDATLELVLSDPRTLKGYIGETRVLNFADGDKVVLTKPNGERYEVPCDNIDFDSDLPFEEGVDRYDFGIGFYYGPDDSWFFGWLYIEVEGISNENIASARFEQLEESIWLSIENPTWRDEPSLRCKAGDLLTVAYKDGSSKVYEYSEEGGRSTEPLFVNVEDDDDSIVLTYAQDESSHYADLANVGAEITSEVRVQGVKAEGKLKGVVVENPVKSISFEPVSTTVNVSDFLDGDGALSASRRGEDGFLPGDKLTLTFNDNSAKTYVFTLPEPPDDEDPELYDGGPGEFLCSGEGLPFADQAGLWLSSDKLIIGESQLSVSAYHRESPLVTITVIDDVDGEFESDWWLTVYNDEYSVELGPAETTTTIRVRVVMSGIDPELSYQWYRSVDEDNYVAVAGETGLTLVAPAGQYELVATDMFGETYSKSIYINNHIIKNGLEFYSYGHGASVHAPVIDDGAGNMRRITNSNVVIPETITFENGVTDTVDRIGYFVGCQELTSVQIPATVEWIYLDAFVNTGLTEIHIPQSVTSLGEHCVGYNRGGEEYPPIEGFTIYGAKGSAAEGYATRNGIRFVEEEGSGVTAPEAEPVAPNPYVNVATVTAASIKEVASLSTITLGPKVKKIAPGAFAGTAVKTVIIKSSKLKKKSVKNAFKGSSVKTVKVVAKDQKTTKGLVGKALKKVKKTNKKAKAYNKKLAKKYKKFMTKKVVGKKVKVKA